MVRRDESGPRHVAIIMDGNGRWARQRHLPRIEGHRTGIKSVQAAVEACIELRIRILTLYTFSVENWKRPRSEVNELMRLLFYYLTAEKARFREKRVRLRAIGQIERLPRRVQRTLRSIVRDSEGNDALTLVLALSYGGRTEIVDAVNRFDDRCRREGREEAPLTPAGIDAHLYAPDLPPPDLIIRTSGEMRLSNFLLWEAARTPLCFSPVLWPDFRAEHLREALAALEASPSHAAGVQS